MKQVAADANPPVAHIEPNGALTGPHPALIDDLLAGRFFSIDFYLGRGLTPVRTYQALDAWLARPDRPIAVIAGRAWKPMREQITTPAEALDSMRLRTNEMFIVRRPDTPPQAAPR